MSYVMPSVVDTSRDTTQALSGDVVGVWNDPDRDAVLCRSCGGVTTRTQAKKEWVEVEQFPPYSRDGRAYFIGLCWRCDRERRATAMGLTMGPDPKRVGRAESGAAMPTTITVGRQL